MFSINSSKVPEAATTTKQKSLRLFKRHSAFVIIDTGTTLTLRECIKHFMKAQRSSAPAAMNNSQWDTFNLRKKEKIWVWIESMSESNWFKVTLIPKTNLTQLPDNVFKLNFLSTFENPYAILNCNCILWLWKLYQQEKMRKRILDRLNSLPEMTSHQVSTQVPKYVEMIPEFFHLFSRMLWGLMAL